MDQKVFKSVCQEVYRRYPAVNGIKPTVKLQKINSEDKQIPESTYLLVFNNSARINESVKVTTWIRVVVNQHGKIQKISSSH